MSLSDEERDAIVALKLGKAERAFEEMNKCFEIGMYSTAANRLYYAIFYATSALLVKNGHEAHTHSGNSTLLNKHFIATGKLTKTEGKLIRDLFRLRQDSDYDDYFAVDKEDIEIYIQPVRILINHIEDLIKES